MKARVLELNASDERGIQVSCYSLLITGIIQVGYLGCVLFLWQELEINDFFSAIVVISEIMLLLSRYTWVNSLLICIVSKMWLFEVFWKFKLNINTSCWLMCTDNDHYINTIFCSRLWEIKWKRLPSTQHLVLGQSKYDKSASI